MRAKITMLKNSNNLWIDDLDDIKNLVQSYFTDLFKRTFTITGEGTKLSMLMASILGRIMNLCASLFHLLKYGTQLRVFHPIKLFPIPFCVMHGETFCFDYQKSGRRKLERNKSNQKCVPPFSSVLCR